MSNKLTPLDSNKEYGITNKINTTDYIMMHKAELRSIMNDNEIFGTFTLWFDRIGMIVIGVVIDSIIQNKFTWSTYGSYTIVGVIFTILGIYYQRKKNKNVENILQEKMNEITDKELVSSHWVCPIDCVNSHKL